MTSRQIVQVFLVLALAACSPEPVQGPAAVAPEFDVSAPSEPALDELAAPTEGSASQACGPSRVEQRRCITQYEQVTGAITTISEGVACTVYAPNEAGHVCAMECARACTEVR